MSIQTQLDRINQGVADQAAIMTQIKDALQGKGSSGGEIAIAYVNCGVANGGTYYSSNSDDLKNFVNQRRGLLYSSQYSFPMPIGWYVSFADETGGFPTYADPPSSVEFIEHFESSNGYGYNLVKVLGDFRIAIED